MHHTSFHGPSDPNLSSLINILKQPGGRGMKKGRDRRCLERAKDHRPTPYILLSDQPDLAHLTAEYQDPSLHNEYL